MLQALHPGDPEAVDKEAEDIETALKIAANHASLGSIFAMGPQRIFHRVMLACVVQIMLQVCLRTLLEEMYANALQFTGVNAIGKYR